jgi:hypothetical protein
VKGEGIVKSENCDDLEKRRNAIKQELSTLDEAITDIESAAPQRGIQGTELEKLKSARETRRRELAETEAQLTQRG